METERMLHTGRRNVLKAAVLAGLAGAVPLVASAQEQRALFLMPSRPLPVVDA